MYVRNRIPKKDDVRLIAITVKNFNVKKETVKKILQGSHKVLVVCENKNRIAGYLCYELLTRDIIFVNYAILDQQYRGKGIAYALFPAFINHVKKQGIIGILGFVSNDNQESMKIFRHWGFCPLLGLLNGSLIGMVITK